MKQISFEEMSMVKGGIEVATIALIISTIAMVVGISTTISSWLAPARAQGKCC